MRSENFKANVTYGGTPSTQMLALLNLLFIAQTFKDYIFSQTSLGSCYKQTENPSNDVSPALVTYR